MTFSTCFHSQNKITASEQASAVDLPSAVEAVFLAAIDAMPDASNMIVRAACSGDIVQGDDGGSTYTPSTGRLTIEVELIQLYPA